MLRGRRCVIQDGKPEQETCNRTGDMVVNGAPRRQAAGGETTISHSSAAKRKSKGSKW